MSGWLIAVQDTSANTGWLLWACTEGSGYAYQLTNIKYLLDRIKKILALQTFDSR